MYMTTLMLFDQSHYSGAYGIDHVVVSIVPVTVAGATAPALQISYMVICPSLCVGVLHEAGQTS